MGVTKIVVKVDGVERNALDFNAEIAGLSGGDHVLTVEAYNGNNLVSSQSKNFSVSLVDPKLLNNYQGAKAAYSLREVKAGYAGELFSLRRSSDNAEQAFTLINGEFPTSDVLSFAGSGDAFGTKWNDITGNNMNAIQTTASLQPALVRGGTIMTLNGKPAWDFVESKFVVPNSKNYFKFLHGATKYSSIVVASVQHSLLKQSPYYSNNQTSSSNIGTALSYDNRNSWDRFNIINTVGSSSVYLAFWRTNGVMNSLQKIIHSTFDHTNAIAAERAIIKINKTNGGVNTDLGGPPSTDDATFDLEIGGIGVSGNEMTGKYQELIFWGNGVPEAAQDEVNSFYNAYTV